MTAFSRSWQWWLTGAIVAMLTAFPAGAQVAPAGNTADRFQLSGSLRVRYEAIGGQARTGFNATDDLFSIRTTVLAQYNADSFRIGAELYDSRAYDSRPGTPLSPNEVNALELVQAYVATDATGIFGTGSKLDLQAGRFTLNIGSRRLVAADDYRNTTSGYTGLRADFMTRGGVRGTIIYVLPQSRRPDDFASLSDNRVHIDHEGFDLVLWGTTIARARTIGRAMAEASYYHLGERDTPQRPTRDRSLDSYGGRIMIDPKPAQADFEIEAFRQTGSVRTSLAETAARQPVSAWFLHADAGYTFPTGWTPRVSLEFDYASGDRPGGKFGRFDTLFGMRRADLAPAGLYNSVARANIATPGIRFEATPGKATDAMLSYRPMWLAARADAFSTTGVRDAGGRSGNFAGHQVDARIRHWLIPQTLRLEADAVLLFKGRFLRDAPNASPQRTTRYVSLNATATF